MPLLPVNDAAAALGVSVSAVRRRLKNGQLRGRRQPTKQGHAWLVEVPDDRICDYSAGDRQASSRVADDRIGDYSHQETPAAPTMALQAARAQEMAAYSTALLEPLYARLEAQAEEIGRLRLELEIAKGREDVSSRPWWAFWR